MIRLGSNKNNNSKLDRQEQKINNMNEEEVLICLKQKGLPTFGTKQERLTRLKKHFGINTSSKNGKAKVMSNIKKIEQRRENRREENRRKRENKLKKELQNEAEGKLGDVEFELMIQKKKYKYHKLADHLESKNMKLCVCVRKRPIFKKELAEGENDCLSVANPELKIFTPKFKVDGITKFLEENLFKFDNSFNENETTEELYECAVQPVLADIFNKETITIFAYGQTGSGKTYTMQGVISLSVDKIYSVWQENYPDYKIYLSFYEIYGGRCYDLLNKKAKVQVLEGSDNQVIIQNLHEREIDTKEDMTRTIEFAFDQRTTHTTVHNNTSSRSHAICMVTVYNIDGKKMGKLNVCDLAGSERAADTKSNKRQRRIEGANINKSLLALKECIRAMNNGSGHIPFRASKLTLSLRDSFIGKKYKNKVIMIACICPGSSSADHSINTLRYADRLKGKKMNQNYNYPKGGGQRLGDKKLKKIEPPSKYEKIKKDDQYHSKKKSKSKSRKNIKREKFPKLKIEKYDSKEYSRPKLPVPHKKPPQPINKDEQIRHTNEDLNFMKQTLIVERESEKDKTIPSDDFVNFHEKVSDIIDLHDEMLAMHLNIIREDAQLLTQESEEISKAQDENMDYDIDEYVENIEKIVKKKLFLYKQLSGKIKQFKKTLKEEEEISMKVRETFYY